MTATSATRRRASPTTSANPTVSVLVLVNSLNASASSCKVGSNSFIPSMAPAFKMSAMASLKASARAPKSWSIEVANSSMASEPLFKSGIISDPDLPKICTASAAFTGPSFIFANLSASSFTTSPPDLSLPVKLSLTSTPRARNDAAAFWFPLTDSTILTESFLNEPVRVSKGTPETSAAPFSADKSCTDIPVFCESL